ncbi:MAG TPA: glutamate--tRNA ligase [Candidatus Woesebacteria bacterium]|nr:glutamate--tRNA ligase [Candidatus Woesebacteria bacterium]
MADTHVRTRIAPSPTGVPHIGNTRTALFDYLLAKKYNGEFILRIEDTDQDRLVPGAIDKIYDIQKFLGLVPDEDPVVGGPVGPYIQTQRLDIYQQYVQELVNIGAAYYCFCSEERLEELHKKDQYAKYDRHCRNLSAEEIKTKLDSGAPFVIRAKIPETGFTVWHDLVQGKLSLPNTECDDKVLMKTNGIPTYHLASVIDDHLMNISHVIRGVEWMMSTPVHLFLYESLGWQPPILAHVPLILGPDKSKLSKRHGAKSVLGYAEDGYLPEAINNFLFYLGFSYQDNSALLTLDEMVNVFDEHKIQKQNAIFDIQKLNYLNSQWIKKLDSEEIFNRLKSFIPEEWQKEKDKVISIVNIAKERMYTLCDFVPASDYFFSSPAVDKKVVLEQSAHSEEETKKWFLSACNLIEKTAIFTSENLHQEFADLQKDSGFSPREAFMSLRVAISGRTVTPPLFDCFVILGKEETLKRLKSVFA